MAARLHYTKIDILGGTTVTYMTVLIDILTDFVMYANIPSHSLTWGGTVPPLLLVSAEKPDLVIIDRMEEKMDIFELTVPLETNI